MSMAVRRIELVAAITRVAVATDMLDAARREMMAARQVLEIEVKLGVDVHTEEGATIANFSKSVLDVEAAMRNAQQLTRASAFDPTEALEAVRTYNVDLPHLPSALHKHAPVDLRSSSASEVNLAAGVR